MRTAVYILAAIVSLAASPIGAAGEPAAFSAKEVEIIREHFEIGARDTHRAKSKHKRLPPGIAKNLARGKPLPPGIAKQSLPYDLERRLPPVREGHERIIVDGRVILVETATRVIRDILYDVLD